MYSYMKGKKSPKKRLLVTLSVAMLLTMGFLSYQYALMQKETDTPVFKEDDVPVLALPASSEKGKFPFDVKANIVLEYYDGSDTKVESMTKFEGVYRANQGIDFSFNGESFEVKAMFSGSVKEVKDDSIFGKSVSIQNGELIITYQSLSDVSLQKGDNVAQGDVIAKAGENIYNKELGNHLHVVVEKSGVIIDPKIVIDKTISEIK